MRNLPRSPHGDLSSRRLAARQSSDPLSRCGQHLLRTKSFACESSRWRIRSFRQPRKSAETETGPAGKTGRKNSAKRKRQARLKLSRIRRWIARTRGSRRGNDGRRARLRNGRGHPHIGRGIGGWTDHSVAATEFVAQVSTRSPSGSPGVDLLCRHPWPPACWAPAAADVGVLRQGARTARREDAGGDEHRLHDPLLWGGTDRAFCGFRPLSGSDRGRARHLRDRDDAVFA